MGGHRALSEHERRQLEQIEAALSAGDPRFADAVRAADPRLHYRRRDIAAALGFLADVGLLLAGVVVDVIVISVAGYVVMLACSMWAVTSYQRMSGSTPRARRCQRQGALARSGTAPGTGGLANRRLRRSWGGWRSASGAASRAATDPALPAAVPPTPARRVAGQPCGDRGRVPTTQREPPAQARRSRAPTRGG